MRKSIPSLIVMVLFFALKVNAQFSLSGEVRPRTELYNGNNTRLSENGDRVGIATQQRTRLYFQYLDESGIQLVFSPQVVHFWGQMPQAYDLLGDGAPGSPESTFSLFEAYAKYKFSDTYALQVGRQAISYADQRWFGALGWAASGRAHDAFVNKFTFGNLKLDLGVALNQTRHTNGLDSVAISAIRAGYKSMQYGWATLPIGKLNLQGMFTNVTRVNSLTSTAVSYDNLTTFGILPSFNGGDLSINASAYFQTTGSERDAYLAAFDVTYKGLGLPITFGVDIVSGDDTSTEKSETWLQPFGTNHKFYGFMDFFYVGETPSFGLNDIYVKTVFKTGEKTKLIAFGHLFSTNQDLMNSESNAVGGYLGSEIDLLFDYQVAKGFNMKLGYSAFFADELFESFKAGNSNSINNWAWLQLTFKPKFL